MTRFDELQKALWDAGFKIDETWNGCDIWFKEDSKTCASVDLSNLTLQIYRKRFIKTSIKILWSVFVNVKEIGEVERIVRDEDGIHVGDFLHIKC